MRKMTWKIHRPCFQLMVFGVAKCCFRAPGGIVEPVAAFDALGVSGSGASLPAYVAAWGRAESELAKAVEAM
jgi:hypothetical protein